MFTVYICNYVCRERVGLACSLSISEATAYQGEMDHKGPAFSSNMAHGPYSKASEYRFIINGPYSQVMSLMDTIHNVHSVVQMMSISFIMTIDEPCAESSCKDELVIIDDTEQTN